MTGGTDDDASGVAFVVIAEHPLTGVGVVGIDVGEGESVGSAFDGGEQEPRSSKIKSEIINKKNDFVRIEFPRNNDIAAIVPQLS